MNGALGSQRSDLNQKHLWLLTRQKPSNQQEWNIVGKENSQPTKKRRNAEKVVRKFSAIFLHYKATN